MRSWERFSGVGLVTASMWRPHGACLCILAVLCYKIVADTAIWGGCRLEQFSHLRCYISYDAVRILCSGVFAVVTGHNGNEESLTGSRLLLWCVQELVF